MLKGTQAPLQASSIVRFRRSSEGGVAMRNATMIKPKPPELTLFEMLADPIVQDVMRRDGVTREQVIHLFENLTARRRRRAA